MNNYQVIDWRDESTMPPEKKTVLACFFNESGKHYAVTSRVDFNFWRGVGRTENDVAWMDLPEFTVSPSPAHAETSASAAD